MGSQALGTFETRTISSVDAKIYLDQSLSADRRCHHDFKPLAGKLFRTSEARTISSVDAKIFLEQFQPLDRLSLKPLAGRRLGRWRPQLSAPLTLKFMSTNLLGSKGHSPTL